MTSAGRSRLPPANRLQRIAACTSSGAADSAGTSNSSCWSTDARTRARNACTSTRACGGYMLEDGLIIFALVGCEAREFVLVERADHRAPFAVAQQHLDAPLRRLQTLLTLTRQTHALLEQLQTSFKRQLAPLQLAHDLFERRQRRLESLRFCFLSFHRHSHHLICPNG